VSVVGEQFIAGMGRPNPAAAPGLRFETAERSFWEMIHEEIGAGFYLDGFVYLFGEGLEDLLPALDAWSFIVPSLSRPMILGYNAYGTLLVLLDRADANSRIGVLDVGRAVWWNPGTIAFSNLVGTWLPAGLIPHFLDRAAYVAWRNQGGRRLRIGEMLAPTTPPALGGTFVPSALEVTNLAMYCKVTGPIYERALADSGTKLGGAKKPPGRAAGRRRRRKR
jgi:hypothetical protein